MRSSALLANLLLLATVAGSGCASFRASDWQANITLPASQDCYGFKVMSGAEERLASDNPKCIDRKARAVWLDSENYKILRKDIQKNCQLAACKQITGAFDELFLTLDRALQKIPTN